MKTYRLFKTAVIVLSILALFCSCVKEGIEKCTANCANIIISGQVWDSSYRRGSPNIPIRVYWKDAGMSPIYTEDEIEKSKTDDQGNFYLNLSIDSSRFHGNNLYIEVPLSSDYIANGSHNGVLAESISQYYPLVQSLRFTMYQAANLKIKLQRTQTDNFIAFDLSYVFDYTTGGIYGHNGGPPLPYTEFNRITGANVYTKVTWRKVYSPGVFSFFTDSIKCIANTSNVLVMDY